jgi:hypothetical protein
MAGSCLSPRFFDRIKKVYSRKRGAAFMIGALIFAITMFIGWTIFDAIKHKKIIKENVISGLAASIVAGIAWYILFVIF